MFRIALGDQNHQIWTTATAETPNGSAVDLSSSTLKFAFPAPGVPPVVADWKTGAWVQGYPAYDLTPLSIPLTRGLWDAWFQLTLGSVVIEKRFDQITVY